MEPTSPEDAFPAGLTEVGDQVMIREATMAPPGRSDYTTEVDLAKWFDDGRRCVQIAMTSDSASRGGTPVSQTGCSQQALTPWEPGLIAPVGKRMRETSTRNEGSDRRLVERRSPCP